MAPSIIAAFLPERDRPGYWGNVTATIDWCEANYEISHFIAEFWNTISNVFMIVPPLFGAAICLLDGLELRYVFCHLMLALVGLGSSCFHGTLLYGMQLLDELPMIWGSAFLIYALVEVDAETRQLAKNQYFTRSFLLQLALFTYCLLVTVVYIVINEPLFHEVAYALMVLAMVLTSLRICRRYEHSLAFLLAGLVSYGMGFFLWNVDNIFCSRLKLVRASLGPRNPLRAVLQGHAWWHVLAGTGTYLGLLFCMHARMRYLKQKPKVRWLCNFWPYLKLSQKTV